MRQLPQLTTQQLDYLVAVADADTWAEAASSRGVSPSALSQGLAELERRLGHRLFERVGRRRIIADDAMPVLDYARSIIAQTSDLALWVERRHAGVGGEIKIGMIDAAAIEHYSEHLKAFRSEHPTIDFHLTVGPSGGLLDQLESAQLDVVVVVRPLIEPDSITMSELLTEDLAVYGPAGAKGKDPADWGPWVLFPTGSHTRALVERVLAELGAPVEVSAESHQPEVLKEMVRLGLGWTILPTSQAERSPDALTPIRRRPVAHRQLVAATRRSALPNPLVDRFIEGLLG